MTTETNSHELTEEQQGIVASQSDSLRIIAFAGTGKTSTLRAYATARPDKKILYLAFNRAVAQEARASFPQNVSCLTIHALAYRAEGWQYRHKLRGNVRANQAAEALGLNPSSGNDLALGGRALQALQHFLSSASHDLASFAADHPAAYKPDAIRAAQRLWELMLDAQDGRMPMLHDGYLKLYSSKRPRLPFDVILLDEAQDTNPVTLAILRDQPCARVFVGDPHQQIYQFRHATNAMADPSLHDQLLLSRSFRFGCEIADSANRLLAVKREPNKVHGGRSGPVSSTHAFIARGNAALYRHAVQLAHQDQQAYWCGGIEGYRLEQLLDVWHLRSGEREKVRDPFIAAFKTFGDLAIYCDEQDQRDLKGWIQLIERRQDSAVIPAEIALLKRTASKTLDAGVTALSTAHKSKGLEFGSVELAEDFPGHELLAGPETETPQAELERWAYNREKAPKLWDNEGFRGAVVLPEEELNLRYVAITRAQGVCMAPQWGTPMFADLGQFAREYPRFLLVGSHAELRPKAPAPDPHLPAKQDEEEQALVGPEDQQQEQPSAVDVAFGSEEVAPAEAAPEAFKPAQPPSALCRQAALIAGSHEQQWFLGALDPGHVRVITSHYTRKYPALNWDWLLLKLGELRMVSSEPAEAVDAFLMEHQLSSAQVLVARFLLDVGLVQEPECATQAEKAEDEYPTENRDPSAESCQDDNLVSAELQEPARRSVRKMLVSFLRRSGQ